ncbi:MAG TPA: M42 family metallopeptidase, partial [Anaerolineae bacterium]|nr:M42 family metallopeptidase [Anaerolineae bacterium]
SPTGLTGDAIAYVRQLQRIVGETLAQTPKGALVATWPGERDDAPRALTAHVDTLGAMVQQIKANGRLQLVAIGGLQWPSVEGEGVTVHGSDGKAWRGSVLPVAASGHATPPDQRHAKREFDSMEVRLDARTTSQQETEDLGIRVGDFASFDPRVELGEAGFVRSRFLDDKACVAAIFAALEALHSAGLRPRQRTTIHISNYEEVGHGASAGLPADLADLVVVDMAVVAPGQASDEFSVTICARDAGGPYDLSLRRELEALALAQGLRWCTDVYLYYQSDGTAYWHAGGNVRVGLIGPGVDASHHYERTHRAALENTARLIAAYLLS